MTDTLHKMLLGDYIIVERKHGRFHLFFYPSLRLHKYCCCHQINDLLNKVSCVLKKVLCINFLCIPVSVHLLDCHLHQVPHSVPLILPLAVQHNTVLHHRHNLFFADVTIFIQIVNVKAKLNFFFLIS